MIECLFQRIKLESVEVTAPKSIVINLHLSVITSIVEMNTIKPTLKLTRGIAQ